MPHLKRIVHKRRRRKKINHLLTLKNIFCRMRLTRQLTVANDFHNILQNIFLVRCVQKKKETYKGLEKWKWKWRDMWPSMVTHTRNLCSAINPSKVHTHSSEHTHHLCCGARGAVGGSVPCSRSPQSWYWGWKERCTFTPPTYNSWNRWTSGGWENDDRIFIFRWTITLRPIHSAIERRRQTATDTFGGCCRISV